MEELDLPEGYRFSTNVVDGALMVSIATTGGSIVETSNQQISLEQNFEDQLNYLMKIVYDNFINTLAIEEKIAEFEALAVARNEEWGS